MQHAATAPHNITAERARLDASASSVKSRFIDRNIALIQHVYRRQGIISARDACETRHCRYTHRTYSNVVARDTTLARAWIACCDRPSMFAVSHCFSGAFSRHGVCDYARDCQTIYINTAVRLTLCAVQCSAACAVICNIAIGWATFSKQPKQPVPIAVRA